MVCIFNDNSVFRYYFARVYEITEKERESLE